MIPPPMAGGAAPQGGAQPQQQQQQQQQQQFQQQGTAGQQSFNPAGMSLDNPMAQMGMQYGASLMGQGAANVNKYVNMATLRTYFNVDNQYVVNKLKMILVPFTVTTWKRNKEHSHQHNDADGGSSAESYPPPRQDVCAPDLYLPLMAFITYILAIGLHMGATSRFTPEVLGVTASSGIVCMILEVFCVRMGFYLLEAPRVSLLDFVAYAGYKYVGVTINTLVGMALGTTVYYMTLLATGVSMSFFMLRSLQDFLAPNAHIPGGMKRMYFLFGLSACQLPLAWFLGTSP